ncbi:MAG: hypothetical protein FD137_1275, partial [Spirochaetes bacterium]
DPFIALDTIRMYSYNSGMGVPISFEGVDLAFGVSLPEGLSGSESASLARRDLEAPLLAALGAAAPSAGLETVEAPLSAFARKPRAQPRQSGQLGQVGPELPAKDLCVRLGPEMADPCCPGNLYRAAVEQCRALSSISAFILEFPFRYSYGTEERRHLDRVARDMEGLPFAIAFFNPGWYSLRVIEALKERSIGLCLMDFATPGPQAPRFDMATSSLVYLKFLGLGGAGGARFENAGRRLASWIPRLEALAPQAGKIRVVFQAFPGEGA